jgi:hypothetical protein
LDENGVIIAKNINAKELDSYLNWLIKKEGRRFQSKSSFFYIISVLSDKGKWQ